MRNTISGCLILVLAGSLIGYGGAAESEGGGEVTLRVATFNLRNYLTMDRRVDGAYRPDYPKPEKEKKALREVIHEANADVLAVQEIGPLPYLEELRQDLRAEGLDYPHIHHLEAADEDRHIAVLSKIPFAGEQSVDIVLFKYFGEEEAVKRGLIELQFETAGRGWSLFVVHLKSRYSDRKDDPESARRRVGEARAVRNLILKRFPVPADASFLIAGDLNDTRASRTVAALLKRGKTEISVDVPGFNRWGQTWTYHYRKEEVYSRADYFLTSRGLLPQVSGGKATVVESPSAALASDHRLVYLDLVFKPATEVEEADGGGTVSGTLAGKSALRKGDIRRADFHISRQGSSKRRTWKSALREGEIRADFPSVAKAMEGTHISRFR